MKPTAEQIKSEISRLREIMDKVPPTTRFGESNTDAIDAEIEVLENDLSEDDIYSSSCETEDEEDEKWSFRIRDLALAARRWMDGEDPESPSKGWEPLVESMQKKKK